MHPGNLHIYCGIHLSDKSKDQFTDGSSNAANTPPGSDEANLLPVQGSEGSVPIRGRAVSCSPLIIGCDSDFRTGFREGFLGTQVCSLPSPPTLWQRSMFTRAFNVLCHSRSCPDIKLKNSFEER